MPRPTNRTLTDVIIDVGTCRGLWLSDDLSGPAADQVGLNQGTYVSSPTRGVAPLLPGEKGCVRYASGKYISCKSGALICALTNSTLVASIRRNGTSGNGNVIYCERGSSGNDLWKLQQNGAATTLRFIHRDDAGTLNNSGAETVASCDNVPRVVGVTKAGTAIIYYRDGLANGTLTLTGNDTMTNATLEARIGNDKADASVTWTDWVGFVAVFGKTLTPGEMLAISQVAHGW